RVVPDEREVIRVACNELIEDTDRPARAAGDRAKPTSGQVHLSWNRRAARWRRQARQPGIEGRRGRRREGRHSRICREFARIGIGKDWNEWESRIGRHRAGMYMLEGDDAGHWI